MKIAEIATQIRNLNDNDRKELAAELDKPEVSTGKVYEMPEDDSVKLAYIGCDGVTNTFKAHILAREIKQGNIFFDYESANREIAKRVIRHKMEIFMLEKWKEFGSMPDFTGGEYKYCVYLFENNVEDYTAVHDAEYISLPTREDRLEFRKVFSDDEIKLALSEWWSV